MVVVKRLTIPKTLRVTVVLSAVACTTPAAPTDALSEFTSELADGFTSDTVTDVQRDRQCFDREDVDFLAPDPGHTCAPRAGMVGRVRCPTERVCDPSECPAGCESCRDPNICVPDTKGAVCLSRYVCSSTDCGSGCRSVG